MRSEFYAVRIMLMKSVSCSSLHAQLPIQRYIRILLVLAAVFRTSYTDTAARNYMKRENSLIKPYNDRWDFIGSTIVTSNYVRLTPDQKSVSGAIWNTVPCPLMDWELHVHFKVHGSNSNFFGDGMAIWYTKHRMEEGPVFGNKDDFIGLGIFLDTYENDRGEQTTHGYPYISAMVNNGSLRYDHDTDGKKTELNGCEAHFRKIPFETYLAIRYERNVLTVSIDLDGSDQWRPCFAAAGVRLPSSYYFGASAKTGDLSDNHDIISMKLYDIAVTREAGDDNENILFPSADIPTPSKADDDDERGRSVSLYGWRLVMIIFLVIVGVIVCIAVGYAIHVQSSGGSSRQRFY